MRIKYRWPDGFRHTNRSGALFNGPQPNRLIDRIARSSFYPATVTKAPTVWAPYLWLDVSGRAAPVQLRRSAYQFRNAIRGYGIPIGAPVLPPAMRLVRPTKAGFAHNLPGFGQAEEVVAQDAERSYWPQIVAVGSVGFITLGLLYGMSKETIGRAY